MTTRKISSSAYRETASRTLKKLMVILLAVVAFLGLRAMENAKNDYDQKKTEPIVIVKPNTPSEGDGPEYVVKLDS
ncbi:MAG: hypothetical protein QOK48_1436, partial [Blastocatellia bacterium]|nr:hypothetical protein [Blastocatellia bacterium]